MIRHVRHTEINKKKWDACIRNASNGSVFAFSWYLDVVSPGWEALVSGDYETVFPLTGRKKLGFAYLYQPFFTYYWDVYSEKPVTGDVRMKFLESIPDRYRFIEIALAKLPSGSDIGLKATERKAQHIALDQDYKSIRSAYSENLLRNLKKAEQSGYNTTPGLAVTELVELFRKENREKIREFGKKEYKLMMDALTACEKNGCCFLRDIRDKKGNTLARAAFLKEPGRILYFKGAVAGEGKKNGAMHFLMDSVIREYSGTKTNFDFGGSNVPGVARFNHHFGAVDFVYFHVRRNRLPSPLRWIKK